MRGRKLGTMMIIILVVFLTAGCGKKKINVSDNLQISFEGYNGYGTAELQNAYAWEEQAFEAAGIENIDGFDTLGNALNIEMAVSYEIEPNENLSNGDTVVVKTVIDEAALEDYDFELVVGGEKTFTVADLPELQELDPFENIEIMYEGISSSARATVVQKDSTKNPMDFYYQVNPNSELKNGDKIIVSISGSNVESEAIEEGYRLTSLEKEFTVNGLSHYAEKLSEIPDDAIEQMKKHTEDVLQADIAAQNRTAQLWSKNNVYTIDDTNFLGNYFLYANNPSNAYNSNICYYVYKVDMTGKEDFSFYYALGYYGLLITEDGSCSYDFDNYDIAGGAVTHGLWMFMGTDTLDEMFNACVTRDLDRFTYESTVVEY